MYCSEAQSVLPNNRGRRYESREPNCSPHPFDIMAIYALYQTIP